MIPLAVDVERFRPVSDEDRHLWRAQNHLADDDLVIVAVGRFAPSKRFDDAIRVLARLRELGHEAQLVLVGEGGEGSRLEGLAKELGCGDSLQLTGPLYDEELASAIGASDVLLSCSEYEGFGLTIIEAMACGTPVVATAVGGVTDLVDDGATGQLAEVGDIESLAGLVVRAAKNTDTIVPAARRRAVERFSFESFGDSFTQLYRRLGAVRR